MHGARAQRRHVQRAAAPAALRALDVDRAAHRAQVHVARARSTEPARAPGELALLAHPRRPRVREDQGRRAMGLRRGRERPRAHRASRRRHGCRRARRHDRGPCRHPGVQQADDAAEMVPLEAQAGLAERRLCDLFLVGRPGAPARSAVRFDMGRRAGAMGLPGRDDVEHRLRPALQRADGHQAALPDHDDAAPDADDARVPGAP